MRSITTRSYHLTLEELSENKLHFNWSVLNETRKEILVFHLNNEISLYLLISMCVLLSKLDFGRARNKEEYVTLEMIHTDVFCEKGLLSFTVISWAISASIHLAVFLPSDRKVPISCSFQQLHGDAQQFSNLVLICYLCMKKTFRSRYQRHSHTANQL